MLWVLADIIGRTAFSKPITGTAELAAMTLIAVVFLQLPHTLRQGHFLRSTLFIDRRSPRKKAVLNIIASILGAALFTLAVVSSIDPMMSAWRTGEFEGGGPVRIPVGPFQTIILICAALVAIQFLVNLVQDIGTLRRNAD
jgi:TRAP-type C4-dicarboxylate transport system permease small subunit